MLLIFKCQSLKYTRFIPKLTNLYYKVIVKLYKKQINESWIKRYAANDIELFRMI